MSRKAESIEDNDGDLAFARATPVFLDEDDNGDYEDRKFNVTSKESKDDLNPMEVEDGVVEGEIFNGEKQPDEFKDAWAAVLFLVQVVAVVGVAIVYAPYVFAEANNAEVNADTTADDAGDSDASGAGFILLLVLSYAIAGVTTMATLGFMMRYSETLVKVSFFFAPVSFGVVALLFLSTGDETDDVSAYFAGWAVMISLLMVCLYFYYKKHIPFAAANLQSALTALRLNSATYGLAFCFSFVSFLVVIIWSLAIMGINAKAAQEGGMVPCADLYDDDTLTFEADAMCEKNPPNSFAMLGLLFGLYWTVQVIQNVLHVTTAGVVGHWWFTPLADPSCCSSTITSSLYRATTYSFGSICFGSLLVALMQTLEQLVRNNRRNGRGGLLLCILQCIVQCLREYLEYFNSWAFVYVALYGYPYIEAGRNVMTLFAQRGWTTFISDRLVFRVLLFCNLGVGAVSGCLAVVVELVVGSVFLPSSSSAGVTFAVAFVVGLIISNVALFCVESATRTVIVCFAENPAAFDEHHPDLSEIMKAGYAQAYPTIFNEEGGATTLSPGVLA